ncbi:MAG: hypothetical protein ACTHJR_11670, partial [Sphingomonas sp.]|uniref:hypothetical protein n=1 Tax=Sphingomonas sp. TaxID=28214 RepID=UPI003F81FE88
MYALLALTLTPTAISAAVEPCLQRDQQRAWEARREGRILPLPEIERRVVPMMRGAQYLGPELDPDSGIYTLKFLRNGTVIWVRVDGR